MSAGVSNLNEKVQGSQAWSSIFRPGSIFRKGYSDSPRNRSYVIMNSVLYHLHPVKVKRHAVKVSYTLCLGGLSFFLFILLTITGIFLMFFYRPTAAQAWDDISALQTSVTFGLLVRNMHRWAAHLMVLSVFLHMARVFYHGAYKPPREFNWVIGVILLTLTLLLSFTGYLLPWDQLALWAVTVGTNMMGYTPVFGDQVRFVGINPLDDTDRMLEFAEARGVGYELLRDPGLTWVNAVPIGVYPTTLFVSPDGEILRQTTAIDAAELRTILADVFDITP